MVSISCDSLRRNGSFEHFKTFVAPNELWRCRRRATTFFESGRTRMNHNVLDDFYHESRFVFVRCKGRYILITSNHDHVIKWKYFPHYWPCVRGIHRWPLNSPHKGQWRGALMFSFIVSEYLNREAGELRRHRTHYDVIVMTISGLFD